MKNLARLIFCLFCVVTVQSEAELIRVAFVGAFSGPDPNTSIEMYRGVEVFLSQGDHSRRFQITKFDNKGSVEATIFLMNEIHQEGYKYVVGLARSDEAIAAAKFARDKDMIFITPFATNPKLRELGPNIFQVCFDDNFQGEKLAEYTNSKIRPKRVAVLVNSSSVYSTSLAESFRKGLSASKSVEIITYSENDLDTKKIAQLVYNLKVDLAFIPDHITRAALLAKDISKRSKNVKFLGGDGFGGQKIFMRLFSDTSDLDVTYSTHWHSDIKNKTNTRFKRDYRLLFQSADPTSGAALTFDAMNALARSVHLNLSIAQVVKNLRDGRFESTTGTLEFQKQSKGTAKKIALIRYRNKKYELVDIY